MKLVSVGIDPDHAGLEMRVGGKGKGKKVLSSKIESKKHLREWWKCLSWWWFEAVEVDE